MTSVKNGLRAVAILEAFKGVIALSVGFGIHVLAGHNLRQFAESVVSHAHLNPVSHFPSIFIHTLSNVSDSKMTLIAIGAFIYSFVRLVEAYGLWRGLLWTEWFALVSGAIYLPFEIYEIVFHFSILAIAVFLLNIVVVWYMAHILLIKKKQE
tara:strand:- start:3012 stop:3470 length:459 start_codon:yes stop_codon:yes gene_type:complete